MLRLIKIYAPSSRDEVLENVVDFGDYDGEGEVRAAAAHDAFPPPSPDPSPLLSRPTALRLLRRCRSPSSRAS